jgi:hypothetical protein
MKGSSPKGNSMKERTTQALLATVAILLLAHLVRPATSPAQAQQVEKIPAVLRAQAVELVDKKGQVVAQLHVEEDGGGNLRLRSGNGVVRVKLGGTAESSYCCLIRRPSQRYRWLRTDRARA